MRYIPVPDDPWNEVIPRLWQGGCLRGVCVMDPPFDVVLTLSAQAAKYVPIEADQNLFWTIEDAGLPYVETLDDVAETVASLHREGRSVLVRCDAGLNRSGLVVASVLVKLGHTAREAIDLVRAARGPDALCNENFTRHLLQASTHGV